MNGQTAEAAAERLQARMAERAQEFRQLRAACGEICPQCQAPATPLGVTESSRFFTCPNPDCNHAWRTNR